MSGKQKKPTERDGMEYVLLAIGFGSLGLFALTASIGEHEIAGISLASGIVWFFCSRVIGILREIRDRL